jgi:hypothetical protein
VHTSLRCCLAILVLTTIVRPGGTQAVAEPYRASLEALVADEATPEFGVPEKPREIGLTGELVWPDEGAIGLALSASGRPSEGYVVVGKASQQLVGFVGAMPQGPVPEDEIPTDQAVQIAQDFAGRHHPELVAEGGEISTSIDETITPLGARTVHLQRTVQGVRVPTFAEVGVRIYDGKVVYFRRKHVPLADDLNLPGTVTAERAQEVAAANVPGNTLEVLLWFDTIHEVIEVRGQQRNVWSVWAEVKTKNRKIEVIERFLRLCIDANTEERCHFESIKPDAESLARYRAAGGERRAVMPPPPMAFADSRPVWSPDASKIAFLSTRSRPGYPSWLEVSPALFVVGADGSDLRCLAPTAASNPCWCPDGQRIAYVFRGKAYIVAASGGEPQVLTPPAKHEYLEAVWVNDNQLALARLSGNEGSEVVLVEVSQPEAEAKVLAPRCRFDQSYSGLVAMPDGKSLICARYGFVSNEDTWDLLKIDLAGDGGEPQVVSENPREGGAAQLVGPDTLFLWDDVPTTVGGTMWMLDLAAGEPTQWRPPTASVPDTDPPRSLEPDDVCFSPDGQRLAFAARVWDNDPDHALATLIWTCSLDGSEVKQVTPWDDTVVPVAGR